MTPLTSTVHRVVKIGSRRFVLGLHPQASEDVISIRELGRRVGYAVPISCLRVQGALAYGRAERTAKSQARKNGVPWKSARRVFLSTVIPPTVKMQRKGKAEDE